MEKRSCHGMNKKDLRVYKANAVIEANYDLSVAEHRILVTCFAQIGKAATDQRLYRVYASDIALWADIPITDAYRDTALATAKLYERSIEVFSGPNGTAAPKKQKFRWIQEAIYADGEGYVDVRLSTSILPYINNLLEQYTVYNLLDIIRMTSKYAVRLYEMLVQWRSRGIREVEIDWFRRKIGVEDKYKNFKDLRKNVIQIAVDQVNEKSPLEVDWSFRKTGRKVTHVEFCFREKARESKPVNTRPISLVKKTDNLRSKVFGIPVSVIEKYVEPGDSWQDAAIKALEDKKNHA